MGSPEDLSLQELVFAINRAETRLEKSLAVTLASNGFMISGNLIPNWQWFEEQADELRVNGSDDDGSGSLFRSAAEQLKQHRDDTYVSDEVMQKLTPEHAAAVLDVPSIRYIHLKDARAYSGENTGIPANGMLWRGKIADISGWTIGRFGSSS